MDARFQTPAQQKGYIQLTTLAVFGFCSIFFPRVLTLIKFPSVINLAHFAVVPWIFAFALAKTRVKDRQQITIIWELIFALFLFLCVNLASALVNDAGIINACMNFLFWCECFLFAIILLTLPLTAEKLINLRAFLIGSALVNTLFAYVQRYVLKLHLQQGLEDNIKGVFVGGGAGHVVGASVALTFGAYYLVHAKSVPLWLRSIILLLTFWHMNLADAKQVLLAFIVGGALLIFSKFKSVGQAVKYFGGAVVLCLVLFWATQNIPALDAFNTWARPEIYGPDGEATLLKTATFRIVPTFYESFLNPWLGIGPGHSVGRLGGWMLGEYSFILSPLGATVHPASATVWQAVGQSWLGSQSSMFSPLFGWAGIWGDLGLLGLLSYLYIWFVVLRRFCYDDLSRLLVFTVFVFGLIFTQMEDPQYMAFVITVISLRWMEHHYQKRSGQPLQFQSAEKIRWRSPKKLLRRILLLPPEPTI
ncbi:MAG: hypothetical protein F6K04_09865 [Leptolyngbya sp. SIO4C5]|nr:hypothetical protein [Leptolyngbya sp. SIO4C5]